MEKGVRSMKKHAAVFLFICLLIFPFGTFSQEADTLWDYQYDVPYVPTPYEVVNEMIRMAGVEKDDILYDLGCGDGRIVITAVKNTGCRGVGIDINPVRIEESQNNAEEAGVTDKVKFLQQNLFETDFSEATVLTLYLLSTVNLELRPKILRTLKPGTRVVSHDFSMKDWEADNYKEVNLDHRSHDIYFWIVPANVSGTWKWNSSDGSGKSQYVLEIHQQFQKINGSLKANGSVFSIESGEVMGDELQLTAERMVDGRAVRMSFKGKANGNTIQGNIETEAGSARKTAKWTAERNPSTIMPIEGSDTLR